MFGLMQAFVLIGFLVVFSFIIISFLRGIMEWSNNNNSPVVTVNARIITKRMSVGRSHHSIGHVHHHSYTKYFVAFEVEGGSRVEFLVPDNVYGLSVEGDAGRLTYQGTRFNSFERRELDV